MVVFIFRWKKNWGAWRRGVRGEMGGWGMLALLCGSGSGSVEKKRSTLEIGIFLT